MYFYNFSTGETVKLPEDTNVGWLKTGALTDGKYSYSYYEYYVNPPRDFINNIISVSYTHLDVYKRQVFRLI